MKNCLVTQLKGSVNNDSLLKLGELRFTVYNRTGDENSISTSILNKPGTSVKISIISGGPFTDTESGVYEQDVAGYNVVARKAEVSVDNKYDIQDFGFDVNGLRQVIFDMDSLAFVSGMKHVRIVNDRGLATGHLSSLSESADTIEEIILDSSGIIYDDMPKFTALTAIRLNLSKEVPISTLLRQAPVATEYQGNLEGDISAFADVTRITVISLTSNKSVGNLSSLLGLTNLKQLNLVPTVKYTAADRDAMNTILTGNGGNNFTGGTLVESYA